MSEPKEPPCPPDRRPHRERIPEIVKQLPAGKTAAVCIDDTPEHIAWYRHEIKKYPELFFEGEGPSEEITGVYIFKVRKETVEEAAKRGFKSP